MNTVDVMLCSSRWIIIGSFAACPRRALAATRPGCCSFFVHLRQTLAAEGSAPAMRTLSTRLSPRIGGNLSTARNPFSALWSVDIFSVMAQGFQACRLQRSVQSFFTGLSTGFAQCLEWLQGFEKLGKIIHKGPMIKK
ncbi:MULTISPECIES: hypothetical protein [unclassified Pseudomonas]|uniref:hypothetical protein n=1 Tax=unclassified Pseudomonas TaxID=196821 RepID=UPI001A9D8968|nr:MULTISPECIES: hypothetical protein [unclassified Pseudomonas]UMY61168.1 hypothetical protein MKK04_23670 [Pseudomonas sp. LS.1a]